MNPLAPIIQDFVNSDPDSQNQMVESIYSIITSVNPLSDICENLNQKQTKLCPDCGKSHYILNGKNKGIQNYKCKECGKRFNEYTGTSLVYIKKKTKLKQYIHDMLSGLSIKKCAISQNISIQTSFDWRHKIIAPFKIYLPQTYTGITEMTEYVIPFSRKGQGAKKQEKEKSNEVQLVNQNNKNRSNEPISMIIIYDRNNNFELKVVKQGEIKDTDLKEHISPKIKNVKKLCLSQNKTLQNFAGKTKISYYIKVDGKKVRGCNKYFHIDNIQRTYNNLQLFLERFKGVSSRYLQNYFYWYMMIENVKQDDNLTATFLENSLQVKNGKHIYKQCKMFK